MAFFYLDTSCLTVDESRWQCHNRDLIYYGEIFGKQPQLLAFNTAD